MSSRTLIAGVLIALGVGAGLYWARSDTGHPKPSDAGKSPGVSPTAGPAVVGAAQPLSQPVTQVPPKAPPRSAAAEQPPEASAPLEAVEPLLELNLVVAGAASADSADAVTGAIDELLGGKHAGKNKAALLKSLNSVQAVLKAQSTPNEIPKEMILTPEAISALTIEAGWLKEHIVN